MLVRCNGNVREMSNAIEPLLVSCMREEQPPDQLLFEVVESAEFESLHYEDLFSPAADTQRDFEVVSEQVDVEDSQLQGMPS